MAVYLSLVNLKELWELMIHVSLKFKMKPLKTENEVGSNIKSTIIYVFFMPGNTPSNSFLPQSSDLVKKYIKEIETSSIEKDRGQGLKKNSMVHEKENMQINTSFPTSAIRVEKCTKEVETRFFKTYIFCKSVMFSTF
ncbi:hypothetical protein H5410_045587 [Solanum commersonii]|uniref:Uncharacterized protein n=1 Tax=Solanum commersonii TaxID=4109 RepID=A0A9J5X9Y4_SOLCO|nr:hypothetical protein H5410_045587 [Solanum commersonii]